MRARHPDRVAGLFHNRVTGAVAWRKSSPRLRRPGPALSHPNPPLAVAGGSTRRVRTTGASNRPNRRNSVRYRRLGAQPHSNKLHDLAADKRELQRRVRVIANPVVQDPARDVDAGA